MNNEVPPRRSVLRCMRTMMDCRGRRVEEGTQELRG
jgi:hypothetical protein